ncbi:AAA family ATPase [Nocardia higoensis]|uniref:AAA family ATPase n=1 Tax=Nocardia higoensis TaxID=228599 RepID=A0ABS0DBL5_9NOCA|nr:BTAD domain-containing putative transcriptional regulator [Nocardia higoensis]MBF6355203.1 AAA family ATPase [Nocardia higoensis]
MTLVRDWSDDAPAVAVLGPLEVRAPDGSPIAVPARKHADLLVILAAERTTRSAEYLCELLWRGSPPGSALVTLQGYVSRLRRTLAPLPDVRIETRPNGYVLRCGGSGTDLDLLDLLSRDARAAHADGDVPRAVGMLEHALGLWRGEALADVGDIAELAPERTRLADLRAELVDMCAEGLLVLGRAGHAVTLLSDECARHPHREGTARLLALALRDCGRTSEALDALVRLRRDLRADLGLDPAPDTVRVESEIRAPATVPVPEPRPRLSGRDDVAAVLDRAVDRSRRGLTVVTVRGAAGLGKTAVVDDAVRRHGGDAFVTAGAGDGGASALATLMPWLDQAALAGRPVPEPVTSRALSALFAEVARETGRVLAVIDDAHRADPDSLRVVAAAMRALRTHPVLLVLAVRPGPLPGEVDAALRALRTAGTHLAVELTPLPDAAVRDLVRAEVGVADPDVTGRIVELSAGSPFVATQLCDLVRAGRALDTGSAAEITAAKLGVVSDSARELAELLAVLGLQAPVALLAGADDRRQGRPAPLREGQRTEPSAVPGFDERVGELVAARVVTVADGVIAFGHELVRAAVLATLGDLRTARWHALVADTIDQQRPDAHAALALHRSAAALGSLDPRAAHACLAAARDALRTDAATECAEFAARGTGHTDPADTALLIEFDLLAGQAHNRLGRYDAATACFDRAGRHCADRADWPGLAATALLAAARGVAGYFSGYGVVQSGSSALRNQALVHRLRLDNDLVAEIQAIEAADRAIHGLEGDLDALADAQARSAPGSRSWPQVLLAEFLCTWDPTTVADRRKIAEELEELAGHDRAARATAVHLRRVCALESGDLRLVRRLSAEFTRLADDGGADLAATQLWWQVMVALLRGDYARSQTLTTRFAEDLGAVDDRARLLAEASILTSNSIELWHRGRLGEALAAASRMAEEFDEDFALVVAMAAAQDGDHERALATIESILALPGRWHGPRVVVRAPLLIEALLSVGRLAPRHRGRVGELTAELEPLTRGWGETLLVQWPGLVCLGPAGLYRGTARGILGLPGARAEVQAAHRRARALGALPYESRAADRLAAWPFT